MSATALHRTGRRVFRFFVDGPRLVWSSIESFHHRYPSVLPALPIMLLFGFLFYRTAWLCDDAYITFRVIDNAFHGFGLRFNVAERVQTYTHPLWMLLLLGLYSLTGEVFYTAQILSIAISLLAVLLLLCPKERLTPARIFGSFVLLFSKAFVDFSSSGLENPLTHLLVAAFVVSCVRACGPNRFLYAAVFAGLGTFNRMDTALLFVPALLLLFPWRSVRRGLGIMAAAFAPFILWELFSLFYYGFFLPNTYYAKIPSVRIEGVSTFLAGLRYLGNSLGKDPLTLGIISFTSGFFVLRRDRTRFALMAGAVLYLGYILWIGGDFMSGRFLSAPFFVAASCLMTSDDLRLLRPSRTADAERGWFSSLVLRIRLLTPVAWLCAVALVLLGETPPLFTKQDYGRNVFQPADRYGIHDERKWFFPHTSLANAGRMRPDMPGHPWAIGGKRARRSGRRIHKAVAIGFLSFYGGPRIHVLDPPALADPLLARLPSVGGGYGHNTRSIPYGYEETLRTGRNRIGDPRVASYYGKLKLAVRGPLWSWKRLVTVLELNLGKYDHLLDGYPRMLAFGQMVEIINLGHRPVVILYVWNEGQLESFLLDDDSHHLKRYRVHCMVDAGSARLLTPFKKRLHNYLIGPRVGPDKYGHFEALRPNGSFTLSVAFKEHLYDETADVYERKFYYSLHDGAMKISFPHAEMGIRGLGGGGVWRHQSIRRVIRDIR